MAAPTGSAIQPRRTVLPVELGLAWCLWLIAILTWWLSVIWPASMVQTVTLSSVSVTAAAWGFAASVARPEQAPRTWLRLGPLMLGYGGLTFGLATGTAWLAPDTLSKKVQIETLHHAHLLIIIGFLTFAGGYAIPRRGGLHRFILGGLHRVDTWRAGRRMDSTSALFAYLLGFSALVVGAIRSGNFGYLGDATITTTSDVSWYTQPLVIVSSLRGFVILALWIDVWSGRRSRIALAFSLTAFDLVVGLFSGMKEAPLVTMLAVGLAYVHVKRRLPIVGAIGVGAGFVLILAPFVESLRAVVRGHSTLTLNEALATVPSIFTQGGQTVEGGFWSTAARFRLIDNVAVIAHKSPLEIPFEPTRDLILSSIAGLIPRAVWPAKPLRMEGLAFYQQYYGGSTYSSSAVTIPGSLYMYGGIGVLIVGMLLLGMLVRSLDDGLRADRSETGVLLMLALFPALIKMEASMPTLLASLPIDLAGWLLAIWLLYRPAGTRSRAPA